MRIHYKVNGETVKTRSGAVVASSVGEKVTVHGRTRDVLEVVWDESQTSDEFVQEVDVILA